MASPKIIIVESSPRKNGNSTLLAREVASGARSLGAEVDTIHLHSMKISPCIACDACQESLEKDCVIDDDMKANYPRLRAADVIVFATPIYWFTVSGQIKLFMDRCYALLYLGAESGEEAVHTIVSDLGGKKFGVVLAYGDVDPFVSGAVNALRTFQDMAHFVGSEIAGHVYGSAAAPGDVAENKALLQQAYALGKKLAAGN